MKISPVPSLGQTVGSVEGTAPQPNIRSLKMNTQATPGVVEEVRLTIPDATVDATKAEPEVTEPLSPQLAALARQRRALQVKEREIADREKALEAKSTTQADVIEKAKLKSDPLSVLLDAGVTYDDLTQAILANQNGVTPEILALREELKALKEGVDKTLTEREQRAEQAALSEMRKEALNLSAQGDEFELVRETGSIGDVMQLIERTYRETGEVLDVKEALNLVETELVSESLKLAKLNKVQGQLAPTQPAQPQLRQMKTLTNRDTASIPMSRKARALAAFVGTLKK